MSGDLRRITAVLDATNTIDELYEGNNEVSVSLSDAKSCQRNKKLEPHEPARRPSLADVTAQGQSRYDVPYRTSIRLDGLIEPEEWHDVPVFELIPHSNKEPLKKRTGVQIAYDKDALYFALRCQEPDMEWLKTTLSRMEDIYNDGFEVFLDPEARIWKYWQFCFDTVPHQFQTLTRNAFAKKAAWEVRIGRNEQEWTAELRFPFSEFDVPPPKKGTRWRANVMRFTTTFRNPKEPRERRFERLHFSPAGPLHSHHQATLFGDLYFMEE